MTDDASRDEGDDDATGTEFTHDENGDPTIDAGDEGSQTVDAGDEVDRPDGDGEDANGRSDPLGDLASTVSDEDRERSRTPDFDDLFDRHDAADIDGDRLWERLEADRAAESSDASESAAGDGESGLEDSTETVDSRGTDDLAETGESSNPADPAGPGGALRLADREIREVEKRSYCQGCEHFTEPPDVACTRDGTDILAVTTMQTFRVADCPFVLEDEALEKRH